ncbi:hypothetical protein PR048_010267 [Dryococelus australis]|uniref:Uncharacterized protein n=1 Tax=Dryococelus australis TaxID=614101 RepID=A0ABQ9I2A1_9NEOP|nr:hypothetical protein PR048_010267 [Dryococelus australis]
MLVTLIVRRIELPGWEATSICLTLGFDSPRTICNPTVKRPTTVLNLQTPCRAHTTKARVQQKCLDCRVEKGSLSDRKKNCAKLEQFGASSTPPPPPPPPPPQNLAVRQT